MNAADASRGPRPWNVFLVEDNPGDVVIMKEALRESGVPFTLQVARTGDEALARLTELVEGPRPSPPSLIFMDLKIPPMSGLGLLAAVKSNPLLQRIPVLVLSTSSNEIDVAEAYRLHANSYLEKPMEFSCFVQMVRSVHDFWNATSVPPPVPVLRP
ncbi:MAG TPA: response regulator [Solimonas sp.]|nr:response regulator [Solimonas sp.]